MFWGGSRKFKVFPISNLSQIRNRGGGVIKFQIFPKFKKGQIILGEGGGGGGQENCGLFPLFGTFFFNASLMSRTTWNSRVQFLTSLKQFWIILNYIEPFYCSISFCLVRFWALSGYFWLSQPISGYCGLSQAISGNLGRSWAIAGNQWFPKVKFCF